MRNVLCLTDSLEDIAKFAQGSQAYFFKLQQLEPEEHTMELFEEVYAKLKQSCDLSQINVVIAEYIEAIPLVYLMRRDGFYCPTLFIPHTNPYPFNILFYFLLVSILSHPGDRIVCGSANAANAYKAVTGITSLNICTFGIKRRYQKGDRTAAREALGLPKTKSILLYTGRFMNDKGLGPLISSYDAIRAHLPNTLLVLSTTHIDSKYYNALAPKLADGVILFHQLTLDQMGLLYQSADVYITAATSVFETYGKSLLEAISCGVPVVAPKWDGFQYYINASNGKLAEVAYSEDPCETPFQFAQVCIDSLAAAAVDLLSSKESTFDFTLPPWAYYEDTMHQFHDLLESMHNSPLAATPTSATSIFSVEHFPKCVRDILAFYRISSAEDIVDAGTNHRLFSQEEVGESTLLKNLHHYIFQQMDSESTTLSFPSQEVYV